MKIRFALGLLVASIVLTACGAGSNPTSDEKPLISPGAKAGKGAATGGTPSAE